MIRILAFLLLGAACAFGQVNPFLSFRTNDYTLANTNFWRSNIAGANGISIGFDSRGRPILTNFGPTMKWVQTEAEFTNAVKTAPVGSTILVAPSRYHFLSTDLGLWTNNLTYDFTGSDVVWGSSSDVAAKPIFHDIRQATTNYLIGGRHVISNEHSTFCYVSNLNTRIALHPESIYRPSTLSGNNALIKHESGVIAAHITDFARNTGYDFYWHSGLHAGAKVFIRCPRVTVGDTALELIGSFKFGPGDAYFDFGTVEPDSLDTQDNGFFTFGETCYFRFGTIICSHGRTINIGLGDSYTASDTVTIEGDRIVAEGNAGTSPILMWHGYAKFKNITITTSNGTPAITFTDTGGKLTLQDVRIFTTNAAPITSSTTEGVDIISSVHLLTNNVDDTIALNGNVIAQPLTNNYSGTNVVVSLNGHQRQVVDATNALLLIVTNSAALTSGKTIEVTLYNNKATNMNVAYSTAGLRFLGATYNTLAPGMSLLLRMSYTGTNIVVESFPQDGLIASTESVSAIPFIVNGFPATTTNSMQVRHGGGAVVSLVDSNGFWLTGMDTVFTNTTTDATVTTLGAVTLPNNSLAKVDIRVTGYIAGTFANIGGYGREAAFVCTNSTVSLVGSVGATGGTSEHNAAWDCTMDASGQTFRIRVTGVAATTIKWSALVRVYPQLW